MKSCGSIRIAGAIPVTAVALAMAACTAHAPEQPVTECVISASVDPGFFTKSGVMTQQVDADICIMEFFHKGESAGRFTSPISAGQAVFNVKVVAECTYDIAFWACKSGCYDTVNLKDVKFTDTNEVSCDSMDAYCAVCKGIAVSQTQAATNVVLKRALAKVNVINRPDSGVINFTAPGSFNVLENELGTPKSFTYNNQSFFLFAPETKSSVDLTIGSEVCSSIPVQRNHITNISFVK